MVDEIPRRMRRFYRGEKPTEEEMKQKSTEIAIKEVDRFRERHDRYPGRGELDEISQNVFDQLKRELEMAKEEDGAPAKTSHGQVNTEKGKSFLEMRREKHGRPLEAIGRAGKPVETGSDGKTGKKKAAEGIETSAAAFGEQGEGTALGESLGIGDSAPEPSDDDTGIRQLAELDELSSLEKELLDDDSDLVGKEIKSDLNVCPRCRSRADDLIYCPNCGEAFCDHCAKAVEVQGDSVKYTCPKCAKDFKKSRSHR